MAPYSSDTHQRVTHLSANILHVISAISPRAYTKFQPLRSYIDDMTDTDVVLLPHKSPNLNAYLERFMRSMKSECLNRMIFFGPDSLESALKDFSAHYHRERNHQGLGNRIINPSQEVGQEIGKVQCRERLGGMLRYYYRDAA